MLDLPEPLGPMITVNGLNSMLTSLRLLKLPTCNPHNTANTRLVVELVAL
jgi:hypothetical protein